MQTGKNPEKAVESNIVSQLNNSTCNTLHVGYFNTQARVDCAEMITSDKSDSSGFLELGMTKGKML